MFYFLERWEWIIRLYGTLRRLFELCSRGVMETRQPPKLKITGSSPAGSIKHIESNFLVLNLNKMKYFYLMIIAVWRKNILHKYRSTQHDRARDICSVLCCVCYKLATEGRDASATNIAKKWIWALNT